LREAVRVSLGTHSAGRSSQAVFAGRARGRGGATDHRCTCTAQYMQRSWLRHRSLLFGHMAVTASLFASLCTRWSFAHSHWSIRGPTVVHSRLASLREQGAMLLASTICTARPRGAFCPRVHCLVEWTGTGHAHEALRAPVYRLQAAAGAGRSYLSTSITSTTRSAARGGSDSAIGDVRGGGS